MNKYKIKSDCLAKAKHFSTMAKDSLGNFKESAEKDNILKFSRLFNKSKILIGTIFASIRNV